MIYDFSDYRLYLIEKLGSKGTRTGLRKKLSEHLSVHTTFISQVLTGKAQLSLEQAEATNGFFLHNETEAEFFIYLVLYERAGTPRLKERFKSKIESIKTNNLNITKKLKPEEKITDAHRQKFYSTWTYGAAHVLSSIEKYQTVEGMSHALGLSIERTVEVLQFLSDLDIVQFNKGRVNYGPQHVHLEKDSELILQHHKNWRGHAANRMHFNNNEDFHYSACLSLSKKDAFKIKNQILENIKNNVDLVMKSKEEEAFVYNVDFYSFAD